MDESAILPRGVWPAVACGYSSREAIGQNQVKAGGRNALRFFDPEMRAC